MLQLAKKTNECFFKSLLPIALLFLSALDGCSRDEYHIKLRQKLDEIRNLTYFDNGMVIYDGLGYGSTFPYWTPAMNFYEDDRVCFEGATIYRAIIDNTGANPATSPKEWVLVRKWHPYLFLRDSARIEDLKKQVASDHPYIRVYALAALAHRKSTNLFEIVVANLDDTTKVEQMTSDVGYTVCPADLMLWYTIKDFNVAQKEALKRMLLTNYSHLIVAQLLQGVDDGIHESLEESPWNSISEGANGQSKPDVLRTAPQ